MDFRRNYGNENGEQTPFRGAGGLKPAIIHNAMIADGYALNDGRCNQCSEYTATS